MKSDPSFQKKHNEVSGAILNCCIRVHTELGPGLLESIYEAVLAHELVKLGHSVRRQQPMPIVYDGLVFEEGYRIDILVDDLVVVEIKSVEALAPVHYKQVLTYLKLSGKKVGLLVNFNENLLKDGFKRLVNDL